MSTPIKTTSATPNNTDVFAVHGADPEVLAYAMAKYSRSALSMKESLREISTTRAEQFLNTFYFQYGHRSIADLAHIAFAIERLSLAAAITLVDEQRWDGQERSTRYQNFRKSGWYTPDFGPDGAAQTQAYTTAIENLFAGYERLSAGMFSALTAAIPRPASLDEPSYNRTLKARAFDVARYLLPLATNTSLGQIVNARTLEMQVSRLLSHPLAEVRALGEKLRHAAASDAWNVQQESLRSLADEISAAAPALAEKTNDLLLREVRVAPTLVKYAAPNEYEIQSRQELTQAAAELMQQAPITAAHVVDLVEPSGTLELDLAAALLYPHCHYSYRQLRDTIAALTTKQRDEIIALGARHRGRHDELARSYRLGAGFTFDILMDIGGFRDMHRHRRCIQLMQPYTPIHGFDSPDAPGQPTLAECGLLDDYNQTIAAATATYAAFSKIELPEKNVSSRAKAQSAAVEGMKNELSSRAKAQSAAVEGMKNELSSRATRSGVEGPASPALASRSVAEGYASSANPEAIYLLPLATRCRSLFQMDFAEAVYISELRSGIAGHYSYRRVAWEMYLAVQRAHPSLAQYFRINDVTIPVDLLQR